MPLKFMKVGHGKISLTYYASQDDSAICSGKPRITYNYKNVLTCVHRKHKLLALKDGNENKEKYRVNPCVNVHGHKISS